MQFRHMLLQAVLAARAKARGRQARFVGTQGPERPLALEHLVVDELIILKKKERQRAVWYRGRGGAARIYTRRSKLSLRLREVPGATMKTKVLQPWFERKYRHRQRRRQGEGSAQHAPAPAG